MEEVLKNIFGYEEFRPLQKEIIGTVLAQKNALVLMPTGGGKSLCYQIPALVMDGTTLVISPLISLMKDQVDQLVSMGVSAAFLNSSLSIQENSQIERNLREGKIKILYVAPERLALPGFLQTLKETNLNLIAIDEAHCISEWGHEFRPEYGTISTLRSLFPKVPFLALTATATKHVRQDILKQLQMPDAKVFVTSFNRPNLTYTVLQKTGKDDTLDVIVHYLEKYKNESSIIYCFSRNETEELARELTKQGYRTKPYHAGLTADERKKTQDAFIKDDIPVIAATVAFGMGINKSNVRLVIHAALPKSVEGYYQETGRAGRDGLPAECVLLFSRGDINKQGLFIEDSENEGLRVAGWKKLYEMVGFAYLAQCRRKFLLEYFDEATAFKTCDNCDTCTLPLAETNGTELALKILSAVFKCEQRYSLAHVSKVLKGAKDKNITRFGHDSLSVYGIAKKEPLENIISAIEQLIARGLLNRETSMYAKLSISPAGARFLKERPSLTLYQPKEQRIATGKQVIEDMDYDMGLFEELRALRKRLADESGLPPYVVFADTTLKEMAAHVPKSLESLQTISGVGAMKLERYGQSFLDAIQSYAEEHRLEEKTKKVVIKRTQSSPTKEKIKILLGNKVGLEGIAKGCGVAISTVLKYLDELQETEEVNMEHLKPARFETIKQAFQQTGNTFLRPVKDLLGDDYSYDEIHLARLFL